MASRAISDLHPLMQEKARKFLTDCRAHGVDVLIYCTWRSEKEQDQLYAMGRVTKSNIGVTASRPLGRVVTNARAGQSAHNFTINGRPASKAWDCCPMVGGKPVWAEDHLHWQTIGKVAKSLDLVWYGWPRSKFKEYPHVEMPLWE